MNKVKSLLIVVIITLNVFTLMFSTIAADVAENDRQAKTEIVTTTEDTNSHTISASPSSADMTKKKVEYKTKFTPLASTRAGNYRSHLMTKLEVIELKERVGVWDPTLNYNPIINGLGTGLAPPTEEEWDAMVGTVEVVESTMNLDLPGYVNHSTSTYFPIVRSQGSQGSCAAWATTYYTAGYLQAKDNGWTQASAGNNNHLMSPAWTFNKVNHGVVGGSHTWTNFYILSDLGGVTWATMPYSDSDYLNWGSEAAWREAPKYKFGNFKYTYPENIDIIKSWVSDGYVLPFAINAYQYSTCLGTGDDTITAAEYNTMSYNHANTIIGYDDSRVTDGERGAFRVVNSWGSNWGSAWNGYGYYWITYKAFAELFYPVCLFYDLVDYEPSCLATWNFTGICSRDSDITIGVGEFDVSNKTIEPYLDGGTHDYPTFMCMDISKFKDDVGKETFYLKVDSGTNNNALISSFNLEFYANGYPSTGATLKSAESPDVPTTTPGMVNNSIFGYQVKIHTPSEGSWYKDNVLSSGTADSSISETLLFEDFETDFPGDWILGDSDSDSGYDYWGNTSYRVKSGFKSAWCAAISEPIFEEDFDTGGGLPDGWINYSEGPDNHAWAITNTDYDFVYGGSDYGAVCDSKLAGPATNITEWLYTNVSFDASGYTYLGLEFLLAYNHSDGDEFAQVLYSNGSEYPTFYNLKTWTDNAYGKQKLDLSAAAGEDEVYIAFRYHGTNDFYMFIDDVRITTNATSHNYDNDMAAYIYQEVNLSGYDMVSLTYDYWLSSENPYDKLYATYYSNNAWHSVDPHSGYSSGWKAANVLVPTTATRLGFNFITDQSVSNLEGAYIDNIKLTGTLNISHVEFQADSGGWNSANGTVMWDFLINTTNHFDGKHQLMVRVNYRVKYAYDLIDLDIDNTEPNTFSPTADPCGWTNYSRPEIAFKTTDDTSGIERYEVEIDSGGLLAQTSPYILPPQSDGNHTITVRAYDSAGNYQDGNVSIYIDTSKPNSFIPTVNPKTWTSDT